ncbi:hypothetical protein N8E89_09340 [Phyllobacterium sp. A18/5-2]|uniref:hypothetical protein n=1 Tax=Phyllobacterium sp. A18/5-2 TaxID=2978392 RepID=UPI0021C5E9E6|nr:hypothetical protein [Phyllobacterium sp. A18/5-2]UXN62919.1 hypothetical protein N8E89_09340 [Phyllobacterium sp. A18/5-2]
MKIEGKKDLGVCRAEAREAVDAVYIPKLNAAMGPKFALYQAKAHSALGGIGIGFVSKSDDPQEIIDRFDALSKCVASIESERQALQARIDAATTASEIDAIIASL